MSYDFRYLAPELINNVASNVEARKNFDALADMWSLGVLYFYMLYGRVPFEQNKRSEFLKQIDETIAFCLPTMSTCYLGTSILEKAHKKMLTVDIEKRLQWNTLFDILDICHKYLNNELMFDEFIGSIETEIQITIDNPQMKQPKIIIDEAKSKRIISKVGEIYYGDTKNTLKHGQGKIIYPNGEQLVGIFVDDKICGYSEQKFKDGSVFKGNFNDDKKHGYGQYIWKDGDSFEGYFKDGLKSGWGKETFANGDSFEGNYVKNLCEGVGCFKTESGYSYTGNFVKGLREGFGKERFENGDKFEGEFHESEKNGVGKYLFPEGDGFKGEYKGNTKNGTGHITYANGSFIKGKWKNGLFNGQMFYYNKPENDSQFFYYKNGELKQGSGRGV